MDSQKILLLGGSGFLGSRIVKRNKKIIAPSHKELDLLNIEKVYRFIEKNKPNAIVYCAGISKMDFAQKNKKLTNELNYKTPKLIANYAHKTGTKIIYISTDAVFDGYKNKFEFIEEDKTKSKSIYGISKQKGEESILNYPNNLVLRVINLFGSDNENFFQRMIFNLKSNKEFSGIIDQVNNPLYIEIAVEAVLFSIYKNLQGIYHLGALDSETNYNFLILGAREMGLNTKLIKQIKFDEYIKDKIAPRKKKSVLISNKFHDESQKKILKNIKGSLTYLNLK